MFWCGSATLVRRAALEDVGGVLTDTVAEDFHTTHRHAWREVGGPIITQSFMGVACSRLGGRRAAGADARLRPGRHDGARSVASLRASTTTVLAARAPTPAATALSIPVTLQARVAKDTTVVRLVVTSHPTGWHPRPAAIETGKAIQLLTRLPDANGQIHDIELDVEVRSCRMGGTGAYRIGGALVSPDRSVRSVVIEYCHVVLPRQRLTESRGKCPSSARAAPGRRGDVDPHRAGRRIGGSQSFGGSKCVASLPSSPSSSGAR